MKRNRLEAFSDGVLAILITIMVLELKVPEEPTFEALFHLWPVFLSYVLSFIYLGIYWNNHHHLLHTVSVVNGATLWANSHLLFWLSLVSFATAWMGESHFAELPVLVYGIVLLMAAVAYYIFVVAIIRCSPENALLQRAIKGKGREIASMFVYLAAIAAALWMPAVSLTLYAVVAAMWLVPDRRIEKELAKNGGKEE